MRATIFHAPGDLRVEQVPDPAVQQPTDAVVRVLYACICGSDLWLWRGVVEPKSGSRIGHEFLGVVEDVGSDVHTVRRGDVVVAPFVWSDGTCDYCAQGLQTSCRTGGGWGSQGSDGGQGEAVRVPLADGTLVPLPVGENDERLPALLTLSDVYATGHHAAVAAGAGPGATVAVLGDGAVGLCGVAAAVRLGAQRVIAMGRHKDRTDLALELGATDVVAERGDEAVERVRELTGDAMVPHVLECVGTEQSWATALGIARDGGTIGYVGVPHEVDGLPLRDLFGANVAVRGGVAPARSYIPELMPSVLDGTAAVGRVFDAEVALADVADGYRAMDERRSIKVLVRP